MKTISLETIKQGLSDNDRDVRTAAMNACQGKDVPLDVIRQWISDDDWRVRTAAMNACQGKDVPLDVIKQGLSDNDWHVRTAAMNACQGKDVPLDVIKQGLSDDDCDVRTAAMKWYKSVGLDIPVIRTIEPPKTVYKKCLCDVIVCAEIPAQAQVRGNFGQKCRASAAKIVNVIGNFAGEQVGISKYDMKTTYFEGDEVEVEDYDYSDEECSKGFHFFCTLKEARDY